MIFVLSLVDAGTKDGCPVDEEYSILNETERMIHDPLTSTRAVD